MKYSYDNVSHQVGVHGDDVKPDDHSYVNRLNVGLASIASLSKYTKEDPNTFVIQNMPPGPINKAVKSSFLPDKEDDKKDSKK